MILRYLRTQHLTIVFPKQSEDYDEVSRHLEMNADYLPSMMIFDEAWRRYLEKHSEKNIIKGEI